MNIDQDMTEIPKKIFTKTEKDIQKGETLLLGILFLLFLIYFIRDYNITAETLAIIILSMVFFLLTIAIICIRSLEALLIALRGLTLVVGASLIIKPIQKAFTKDLLNASFGDIVLNNYETLPPRILFSIAFTSALIPFVLILLFSLLAFHYKTIILTLSEYNKKNKSDYKISFLSHLNNPIAHSNSNIKKTLDYSISVGTLLIAISAYQYIIDTPTIEALRLDLLYGKKITNPQLFQSTLNDLYNNCRSILESPTLILIETVTAIQLYKVYIQLPDENVTKETHSNPTLAKSISVRIYHFLSDAFMTKATLIIISLLTGAITYYLIDSTITTYSPIYTNISPYISFLIAYFTFTATALSSH